MNDDQLFNILFGIVSLIDDVILSLPDDNNNTEWLRNRSAKVDELIYKAQAEAMKEKGNSNQDL